eukprot:TRINITY_DN4102_c0_g1_i1.p1 TRINITY_DN4102_c0_g1~~TRINITY_DN4102_c0_g1_i1.p1  ORF type:complete len:581 (-),score=71.90 TRINITY_DN4102_c0_g1_i1:575-2317(-)
MEVRVAFGRLRHGARMKSLSTNGAYLTFLVFCFVLFFTAESRDSDERRPQLQSSIMSRKQLALSLKIMPWSRNLKQLLPFLTIGSPPLPIILASGPAAVNIGGANSSNTLILAQNQTRRPDILSKFRKYRGGWNITNKHYWTSLGSTGAPGFILAILWFTSFGFALMMLQCCGRETKKEQEYLQHSPCLSLILLIVFTCITIVGCTLLSVGQDKFHHEISNTLVFVVKQSDITVENLRNVSSYLDDAKSLRIAQSVIPDDKQHQIGELNTELIKAADELEDKTYGNAEKVQKVLDVVRDALVVVAVIMLLLAILGLLLAVLGFQHIIYMLVIFGWMLVAGTFILCGVFIVLNNAIGDACVAMQEWVNNPDGDTTLDHILPCVNQSTSNQALYRSKEVTSVLVNIMNGAITDIGNGQTNRKSGRQIPQLCNPFDQMLKDRACSPREVHFTNAAQVWWNYTCSITNDNCASPGMITEKTYAQLVAAVNLCYGLMHYAPFLLNLIDCTFVRNTFKTIVNLYCPDLKLHLMCVYVGLALISVGVMLSLVFWIICVQLSSGYSKALKNRNRTKERNSMDIINGEK